MQKQVTETAYQGILEIEWLCTQAQDQREAGKDGSNPVVIDIVWE